MLGRIEQKDFRTRNGALNVVKHIVTRLDKELEDKKGLLVSGVKPLVSNETVLSVCLSLSIFAILILLQVKKSLAQVVIAMASHGYLLLEGGESLIEFIIRGSALTCEEDKKVSLLFLLPFLSDGNVKCCLEATRSRWCNRNRNP